LHRDESEQDNGGPTIRRPAGLAREKRLRRRNALMNFPGLRAKSPGPPSDRPIDRSTNRPIDGGRRARVSYDDARAAALRQVARQ
ncbi:Hypothetical predicted protein, partial [Olea europaea subsp. europaea]